MRALPRGEQLRGIDRALHADPAHPWTVAELAEQAVLSRSAFARQFTDLLGMRLVDASPDRAVVEWDVTPDLQQPYGIAHGGVYCTAVETAASWGAALWYGERGKVVGVSNTTDFLRSVREGRLTATATWPAPGIARRRGSNWS